MLWLVMRRHRLALIVLAAVGAVLSALYLIMGSIARSRFPEELACLSSGEECPPPDETLTLILNTDRVIDQAMLLAPGVIAAFVGATLIGNELAQRTHRFLWTQETTRRRWFAGTVGLVFGVMTVISLLTALCLQMLPSIGFSPLTHPHFDTGPLVLPTTMLAAGSLALLVAALTRRVLFGLVAGLIAAVTKALLNARLRRTYATPETNELHEGPGGVMTGWPTDNAHIVSTYYLDESGTRLSPAQVYAMEPTETDPETVNSMTEGLRHFVEYQPADRYWLFQLIESGLLLGVAAVCLAGAFWVVHRRAG